MAFYAANGHEGAMTAKYSRSLATLSKYPRCLHLL